jgi:hypothetical protein
MLPNHQYPIPQREPLIRIIRNCRIHRSVPHRNARRRRNYPPNDPEGQVAWDVVQVRIGELPKQIIRKYASELAPQRLFDASRSCSSTLSVCS